MKFIKLIIAFAALVSVFGRRHRRRARGQPEFDAAINKLFADGGDQLLTKVQELLAHADHSALDNVKKCPHPQEGLLTEIKNYHTANPNSDFAASFAAVVGDETKRATVCEAPKPKAGGRRRRKYFY
jgi:hypothetical protein